MMAGLVRGGRIPPESVADLTGICTQRTRQVGLAGAGRAKHQDVQAAMDPLALRQFENEAARKPAPGREVQVFQAGRQGEAGSFDPAAQAVVLAAQAFAVDHHPQAVFEGEFGILGIALLLLQRGLETCQA